MTNERKEFYNTGGWHHGNGVLVCGTLRIAVESFDNNCDKAIKDETFDWICDTLNKASLEASPTPNVDAEDTLRISKSGYSVKVGWQEKRIIAKCPYELNDMKGFQQWLEDAQRLCDGWNNTHPASPTPNVEPVKPEYFHNKGDEYTFTSDEISDWANDNDILEGDEFSLQYIVTGTAKFVAENDAHRLLELSPKYYTHPAPPNTNEYCNCKPTECNGEGINRCRWKLMNYQPAPPNTEDKPK